MKEKKRLEIRLETRELIFVRFPLDSSHAFCAVCRQRAPHLSIAQAVAALSLSEKTIFRLVEKGAIHSFESEEGFLRLCAGSLAAFAREPKAD